MSAYWFKKKPITGSPASCENSAFLPTGTGSRGSRPFLKFSPPAFVIPATRSLRTGSHNPTVVFPTDMIQKWSLGTSQGCSISEAFFFFFLNKNQGIPNPKSDTFPRYSNKGHFPRDLICRRENPHVCGCPGQDGHMGRPPSGTKERMPMDPQTLQHHQLQLRLGLHSSAQAADWPTKFVCFFGFQGHKNDFTQIQIFRPAGECAGQ